MHVIIFYLTRYLFVMLRMLSNISKKKERENSEKNVKIIIKTFLEM